MTLQQYKQQKLEEFNKKFRNESWYPNNWEPIESYISSLISETARVTREVERAKKEPEVNITAFYVE